MLDRTGCLRPFGMLSPYRQIKITSTEYLGTGPEMGRSLPMDIQDTFQSWIDRGVALRWKEFVRNRVRNQEKVILTIGILPRKGANPADKLTRGLSIYTLVKRRECGGEDQTGCLVRIWCDTSHNEIKAR
ncbi:hypothetical protein TNIN_60291 [Trichonephila inaurata madagascariensis]|uniref:Uncharacterized protein n=1 Tax=Trichonephila inaurata madagascariensis TaxID=2747483 RepID=A0A8X6JBI3_9ARAC|nr:hypothetical protein TNIN_60291 [Trichonephila inaurata madagascariensis]